MCAMLKIDIGKREGSGRVYGLIRLIISEVRTGKCLLDFMQNLAQMALQTLAKQHMGG